MMAPRTARTIPTMQPTLHVCAWPSVFDEGVVAATSSPTERDKGLFYGKSEKDQRGGGGSLVGKQEESTTFQLQREPNKLMG